MSDLHAVLTATGSAERPVSFGKSVLLGLKEMEAALLAQSIYGDVGGVLFPRLKIGSGARKLVHDLSQHWTGLKLDHLRRCASQAFSHVGPGARPGVIMLSFGADRADIVLEAVRSGVVHHLIISPELGARLDAQLGEIGVS